MTMLFHCTSSTKPNYNKCDNMYLSKSKVFDKMYRQIEDYFLFDQYL